MSDQVLSVKDWGRFQQYKDRNPTWIKFYLSTLDDYEFSRLPDAYKAHVLLIWLLAARCDNRIPYDQDWIAERISVQVDDLNLERLINDGWLFVRNAVEDRTDIRTDESKQPYEAAESGLAGSVAPEEKRREETETETDTARARKPQTAHIPDAAA